MTQDFSGLKVKLPTLKESCAERAERERAKIVAIIFMPKVKRRFLDVPRLLFGVWDEGFCDLWEPFDRFFSSGIHGDEVSLLLDEVELCSRIPHRV